MDAGKRISDAIDGLTRTTGRVVCLFVVLAIAICAANAVLRKFFGISSNGWLEMQWYLYGAAFLLTAADVLRSNDHVRVDYAAVLMPARLRLWIELCGHLFCLIPFCAVMIRYSVPYALHALVSGERSLNVGGLPLWPIKAAMALGFVLLGLQAVSELLKTLRRLRSGEGRTGRVPTAPAGP